MFNLNTVLLNTNVVSTVVDVNASIFSTNPHCRLIAFTFLGVGVL